MGEKVRIGGRLGEETERGSWDMRQERDAGGKVWNRKVEMRLRGDEESDGGEDHPKHSQSQEGNGREREREIWLRHSPPPLPFPSPLRIPSLSSFFLYLSHFLYFFPFVSSSPIFFLFLHVFPNTSSLL